MTFKIRPYLRDHYPCPVEQGGCGAITGHACTSQAGNPTQPHTPRWNAHRQATKGESLWGPAPDHEYGNVGIRVFLRDSYICAITDGGCGALRGHECTTRKGEAAGPHAARWNALDRTIISNRPNMSVKGREVRDRIDELQLLREASRNISSAQRALSELLERLESAP